MTNEFLTELDEALTKRKHDGSQDIGTYSRTIYDAATMLRDLYPLLVQLCEARKGATEGDWLGYWCDWPIIVEAGCKCGAPTCGIIATVHGEVGEKQDEMNQNFIALSANLTTQIQKILEGK